MADLTFKADLLPNSDLEYNIGSTSAQWNVFGTLEGTATFASNANYALNAASATYSLNSASSTYANSSNCASHAIHSGSATYATSASQATHAASAIYAAEAPWSGITGKPSTYPPSSHTHNWLELAPGNKVSSTGAAQSDDTGPFTIRWYTDTNKIASQPTQYGFLITCAADKGSSEMHQLWLEQCNGSIYHRGTNGSNNTSPPGFKIVLDSSNYTSYTVTKTGSGASGTWGINITGSAGSVAWGNVTGKPSTYSPSSHNHDSLYSTIHQSSWNFNSTVPYSRLVTFDQSAPTGGPDGNWYNGFVSSHSNYLASYILNKHRTKDWYVGYGEYKNGSAPSPTWYRIWLKGDSVTGAVWNDYAEYRESHCILPGYVVQEIGDDTLQLTTERLDHFAGVTSDTWGFAQGETEKAKTPIAVAGRVLVYPGEDRNSYKPGDCVCAGPGGKVYIMTRQEVRDWPDRIVGTVSCVPDYEMWGGGEGADRDPVPVNGRIWIKVK